MTFLTANLFDEMDRMGSELDRFFGLGRPSARRMVSTGIPRFPGRTTRYTPPVNLEEAADRYTVQALVPGIDPKTLDISFSDNRLSISGDWESLPEEVKNENLHRNERAAGTFTRVIKLRGEIDREGISASYEKGLLNITLPKTEAAKPRKIDVTLH